MFLGLVASCRGDGGSERRRTLSGTTYLGNQAFQLMLQVVDRCRRRLCGSRIVRMDTGFLKPGLLERRSVPYIARTRKNEVLYRMVNPHLTQQAGRSSDEEPRVWLHEMTYQADSWDRARWVVLIVERPGELYPDDFWLLTSLDRKRCGAEELQATYRSREKEEEHMGELMDELDSVL